MRGRWSTEMMARSEEQEPVAATSARDYTDSHDRAATSREPDRSRRGSTMFKKTEETEWTRFSRALSPREREEAGEEAVENEAPSPPPPPPGPPATRQSTSDVNVSA